MREDGQVLRSLSARERITATNMMSQKSINRRGKKNSINTAFGFFTAGCTEKSLLWEARCIMGHLFKQNCLFTINETSSRIMNT